MDVTTLALAVDSTQVNSAAAVLDKFAAAGTKAETAAGRLTKAAADQGRAISSALVPAANKGALAFKTLAEASEALGPAAAAQLAAAGAFGAIEAKADGAAAAVHRLGNEAQLTAAKSQSALAVSRTGAPVPLSAANPAASVSAVNALTAAAARADSQVETLGNTLRRSIGQGARTAESSIVDLSRATTSLGASSFVNLDKATTSLGATAAKADEATRAVHQLRNEIALVGPLASAGTSLGARVGPVAPANSLREAIERRGTSLQSVDPRLGGARSNGAGPVVAGNEAIAKSAKLAAFQQQQLGFQIHDFFVQVASGGNPLTALVQQGSQLSGTFGGAGNAFRAVTALITPMRAAFIAGAAAVGTFVAILARAETSARDLATLQAQLAGTGRSGMFSTDELKEFLQQLALAPGVTRETAAAIVSELSKVKDIGGGLFRDLAGSAADYAKATGTDIPTAAKSLAKAFADPERGAKQLDETLGALSSTQLLQIERLSRLGDVAGAQRVLFDALQGSIRGLADNAMTPLQRSINDLGNSWEGALRQLDQSQGLRTLNALLAAAVNSVRFLVDNAPKIGGLGTFALSVTPGGLPGAVAGAIGGAIRAPFVGAPTAPGRREVSGKVTDAGAGASATLGAAAKTGDDEIKRALGAASAYQSQAGQLAALTQQRKTFNSALAQSVALYGKDSEQAKKFRDAIAGVDERIASAKKKGVGRVDREPEQIRRVTLEADLGAFRDALQQERDALAFHGRFLQGEYQAGNVSLRAFWEQKKSTIAEGVRAEIAELDKEKARLTQDRDEVAKKDPSEALRLQKAIDDATRQQEKLRREGANEVKLANQQEAESFRQLNEQVLNYRANLLQLQGDEIGAAKLRAHAAIEQTRILAKQSQDSANPITAADQAAQAKAVNQQTALNAVKVKTSTINQLLEMEEERISLAARTGAIGQITALGQVGAAREKALAQLEQQVEELEKLSQDRPLDIQLSLDTQRARLELDKLRAEMDPLKEHFDGLFRDAGSSFFEDLMNGVKGKDALKSFASTISREINSVVASELSTSVFGKDGALGGAGGFFASLFGGKKGAAGVRPEVDTTAVQQSLSTLQAAGIDPTTNALTRLQLAADAAAGSLQSAQGGSPGAASGTAPLTTGDFARMDRGQVGGGEQSVMDLFRDASKSSEDLGQSNAAAANAVLRFAQAASKGQGALSQLPAVIQAILMAASSGGGGGGGVGGFVGALGSLMSTGSMNAAGGFNSMGFGTGAGFGNMDMGLFFHRGGVVGKDKDLRPVPRGVFADAGKYHSGGVVGQAADVPKLAANEVPAILMGGPKGTREEVITARDPRHRDNMPPALLRAIERAPGARQIPAPFHPVKDAPGQLGRAFALSVVGGRGGDAKGGAGGAGGVGGVGGDATSRASGGNAAILIAAAAQKKADSRGRNQDADLKPNEVPAILLRNEEVLTADDPRHRDRLSPALAKAFAIAPRYHTGGIAGLAPDRPDVLRTAGRTYLTTTQGGIVRDSDRGAGGTTVNVNVTATPGMTREQALNQGREIGRGMQVHMGKRARNS